jgi:hypothetical protein
MPSTGWKFAGWSGPCTDRKPTCAIDLSLVKPLEPGADHFTKVIARFVRG